MSIRAVGIDLIEVGRVAEALEKWGTRFVNRVFTESEQEAARRGLEAEAYAARYAAKEAVSKCLGTGFKRGVRRRDIEVVGSEWGAPSVRLHGQAGRRAAGARFVLSLTHTSGMAAAVAIMLETGE